MYKEYELIASEVEMRGKKITQADSIATYTFLRNRSG